MGRKRSAEEMLIRQMSVPEAAYVAGVIDGEGTISLTVATPTANRPKRYVARLQIANTDLSLLGRLNEIVGGGRFDGKNRWEHNKTCYALTWMPTQARQILPQLLPYLVAKRRQAEAVLRYFDLTDAGSHGSQVESLDEIEAICREVKRLNHRGKVESDTPEWEFSGPFTLRPVFRQVCEHCDAAMSALMPHKRFCSEKCQAAHYQETVRGPKEKAALVHDQVCQGCGATFETDYASRKFCGRPCYLRHRRKLQAEARHTERQCEQCGNSFPFQGGKKRYCSGACVQAAYQQRRRAETRDRDN